MYIMNFTWFWDWGIVVLFYVTVMLLIYFNRSKFKIESKIIALYRTKIGLKLMDKIGLKHPRFIGFLGYVGIWVGFLGMFVMLYFMLLGLYQLLFVHGAAPLFSPVIPGIQIPGSPIKLPLVEGLIALFVVVVIHEFSHGVVARAHKIKVKNSGFVMFGPLPGAFVEPDEKQLLKKPKKVQLSVFAAGPWSNIILSVVLFFVIFGLTHLSLSLYDTHGVVIEGFTNEADNFPDGRLSQFSQGEVISGVDGFEITNTYDLATYLQNKSPGDSVNVTTNLGTKKLVLGEYVNPETNATRAVLGIQVNHVVVAKNNDAFVESTKGVYFWLFGNPYDTGLMQKLGLVGLIYILSLGIGLVNLLPLGPTDGGRMYLLVLQKYFKKKTAMKIWSRTALVLIVLLAALILVPIFMEVTGL